MQVVVLLVKDHIQYKCPACGWHDLPVKVIVKENRSWEWNGDLEKPTITPSVRHFHNGMPAEGIKPFCCHYYIRNGVFEFLPDCTHDKAGQTIPMTPYTDAEVKLHSLETK